MSNIFKGMPNSSLAAFFHQEKTKGFRKPSKIFSDIEAHEKMMEEESEYPKVEEDIKEQTGLTSVPKLRFKGRLDGRIPKAFPGLAKEGCFWLVEYRGQIGGFPVNAGDIVVRLSLFDTDWVILPHNGQKLLGEIPAMVIAPQQPGQPRTKPAPGPQKRKVILEDE